MIDADIRAHNAVSALHAMYGDMLGRFAALTQQNDAVMRQMAADAKEYEAFKRRVSGMVVDRQQKAKQALALVRALPSADDGLNGVDANVAEIVRLLEMMLSEQLPMPAVVGSKP